MDKNDIIKMAKSASSPEDILNKLSDDEKNAVENLLKDKEKTNRLLSSPEAKALFKALFGDKK